MYDKFVNLPEADLTQISHGSVSICDSTRSLFIPVGTYETSDEFASLHFFFQSRMSLDEN